MSYTPQKDSSEHHASGPAYEALRDDMTAHIKDAFAPRENVYVCRKCGGHTGTVDIDKGVTPFMIDCRASGCEGDCDGMAYSSFYPKGPRPPHIAAPAWEWYRPTLAFAQDEERKYPGSLYHFEQGGLWLRARATPSPAPTKT